MIFTHFCFYRCVCIYLIVLVQNYCEVNVHKRCILVLEYTIASVSTWQNVVLQPIEVYKEVFICTQNFHWHGTEFNECLKSPNMGFSNQGEGTCVYQDEIQELFPKQRIQKSTSLYFQLYLFIYLFNRRTKLEGIYICNSQWWGFIYT